MLGLIKSDFYKLFRMKSFYICGVIAALLAGLGIWAFDLSARYEFAKYGWEDLYVSQFTGVYSMTFGLTFATLFVTIMISMFIPGEFKFGTIKNIISKGFSRVSIYFSKFVTMMFVSFSYAFLCMISAFAVGTTIAGVGDFDRSVFLDIMATFGLFLLAQIAFQSICQMVGFLVANTGWTVTTNILIFLFLPDAVLNTINLIINNLVAPWVASVDWLSWIKIDNFNINDYWPFPYIVKFVKPDILHMDFYRQMLVTGIIVCVVYIVVASTIGLLSFRKRDID